MITRISLLVVILASALVCGLSLTKIKQRTLQLQSNLATQTQLRAEAEAQLASTKTALGQSDANLKQTQTDLDAATAQVVDTTAKLQVKSKELQSLTVEMDSAQETLAQQAAQIKSLDQSLTETKAKVGALAGELETLKGTGLVDISTGLPSDFKSNVVAIDPKWHFVVLDAGESKGVFQYAELMVTRKGQLVGKLQVKSVEKNTCIANVVPGWQVSQINEGDLVFPVRSRL